MSRGQELTGDDYEDNIGSSVSLSEGGQFLAVGSPGSMDCAYNTPSCVNVKVYQYGRGSEAVWTQIGQQLTGAMGFGGNLKISGDGSLLAVRVPVCNVDGGDCFYASEGDYDMKTQLYALSDDGIWVKKGSPLDADLMDFSTDGSTIAARINESSIDVYQLV